MKEEVKSFMKKLKERRDFHRVKFVILFGSRAEGRARKDSDYDFAIYYDGDSKERFKFQIALSENEKFDIKIFQDLPLFIKKEVLKGKVIYAENLSFVYDTAYETIKEFEDFKRYYYDYIGLEKIQ